MRDDSHVTAGRYGTSVRGESLWQLTVDHGGGSEGGTILVLAGLHAMEHVGPITALALVARAAAAGPGAAAAWRRRRLVVAPLANPDGFRAAVDARGAGARRTFLRGNARGVDLNRNFAEGWNDRYYLTRLLPRVFSAGPAPLSEPETAALDALATTVRPAAVISLHAFGEWIFLPWACRREASAALPELTAIAQAMTARQTRPYKIGALGQRSRLFIAPGAELDHFHARHGAYTFLLEIGSGPPVRDWLQPFRWYTPRDEQLARDVANVLPALDAVAEAHLPARPL